MGKRLRQANREMSSTFLDALVRLAVMHHSNMHAEHGRETIHMSRELQ